MKEMEARIKDIIGLIKYKIEGLVSRFYTWKNRNNLKRFKFRFSNNTYFLCVAYSRIDAWKMLEHKARASIGLLESVTIEDTETGERICKYF